MEKKVALALDVESFEEAIHIANEIKGEDVIIKIGYVLFIKYGAQLVKEIKNMGFDIFLDLKLHDIPNTVYNGVRSAVDLGVDYLTIHTLGGKEMLEKAVEAKKNSDLKLLGVTLLTSHSEDYIHFIGSRYTLDELAVKLAKVAVECGVDGIVSSPFEARKLKTQIKNQFISVTPGIRIEGKADDDQKRAATPSFALKEGADILVIGRPVLKAKDRKKVLREIITITKNA